MAEQRIASPQGIKIGHQNIEGAWYIVLKIHGQGSLKFSPNIAHKVARELMGEVNVVDKLAGNIIHPWRRFRS